MPFGRSCHPASDSLCAASTCSRRRPRRWIAAIAGRTCPFSVFLSVPRYGTHARIERVTEALVHETMHIQLSLLERRLPLVESDHPESVAFSPWRNSERNVQGVLHALHVFVIVRRLWQRAVQKAPRGLDRRFAEERVRAIRDEVGRAQLLAASPGLTREGRQLVRRLLALGDAPLDDGRR